MRLLKTTLLIAAIAGSASAAAIIRCELNGKPVNPNNGAETAGLTGLLRCREEDTGHLQREQTLQNGQHLGLERFFDREGRLLRERSVNARGNSQGRVAEFWPNGQLKREATEDNGTTQGTVRRFSEQGRLERLSFHADGREQFVLEFNAAGQPSRLQCPAASLLAEDRQPCGFDGAADTVLYNPRGEKARQVRYAQGQLQSASDWNADGTMAAQQLREAGRRVHRSYSAEAGKPVLREERIFDADDRTLPDRRGALASHQRWGASGQLIEKRSFTQGRETLLERWYLNGARRERTATAGDGAATRVQRELYDDTGTLTDRGQFTANQNPTGRQQAFHANGRVAVEELYSAPDARGRTRAEARKTWDDTGTLLSDDTLLEDGSRVRRSGGAAI